MTDKEYYSDTSMITNTMLGWILSGAAYYLKKKKLAESNIEETTSYLTFGNAVHCKLLEPDEFGKRYGVVMSKRPTGASQKTFCDTLISTTRATEKALIMAYKMSYSTAKLTDEKMLEKSQLLYEDFKGYITESRRIGDKIELTSNEYSRIENIVRNVRNHKAANRLLFESTKMEAKNEAIIKFKFMDIDFKSKLDRYIIDPDKKKITVCDVKTHASQKESVNISISFVEAIKNYSYDRQLYLYTAALYSYFTENYPDEDINEYTVEQKIIVIQSNFDNYVKVFNITDKMMESGERKVIKAVKRYKYFEENGYEYDYDTKENGEEDISI